MKKALTPGALRSVLIAAAVAALVAFVGLQLAEGEPPPPQRARPVPTGTPGPVWTPNPFHAPGETPTPPPSPTAPPNSIVINGRDVPLGPGMRYYGDSTTVETAPGVTAEVRTVRYDPDPEIAGNSSLSIDQDGRIVGSHIRPEDLALFQALLDAALPQLPTMATIAGRDVTLPPGMTAGQLLPAQGSTTTIWSIKYTPIPAKSPISLMWVDDNRTVVRDEVHPEDRPVFQSLLDQLGAPP